MDKRILTFFINAYDERNFSKAARKSFISQQGMSDAIKRLEAELGVSLFTRNKGLLEPTEYGIALRKAAPSFIDMNNQIFFIM
jgi:DNA-binding transcriptional LysR family regulator